MTDELSDYAELRELSDEELFARTQPRVGRFDEAIVWLLVLAAACAMWAFGTMVFYEFFLKIK
jgi:hypothetical protein